MIQRIRNWKPENESAKPTRQKWKERELKPKNIGRKPKEQNEKRVAKKKPKYTKKKKNVFPLTKLYTTVLNLHMNTYCKKFFEFIIVWANFQIRTSIIVFNYVIIKIIFLYLNILQVNFFFNFLLKYWI